MKFYLLDYKPNIRLLNIFQIVFPLKNSLKIKKKFPSFSHLKTEGTANVIESSSALPNYECSINRPHQKRVFWLSAQTSSPA